MTELTGARPQNLLRGVAMILAAAFLISVQDVVFKLFSSQLTLWQIFALRGLLAVPLLLTIGRFRRRQGSVLRLALSKWAMLRALLITTTFLAFYAALPFLSLSTVGAANYIAPVFVTLLSAYAIAEPPGVRGWVGVIIGFAGVIVLLQPGTDAFSIWAILPICGAAFYALAHITTRTRCQGIPLSALALSQNLVMLAAGLAVSAGLLWLQPQDGFFDSYPYIFGLWAPVSAADWMVLILLAAFAVAIGMMLAGAYRTAPPSVISTFEYSYLAFAAAWDIHLFGTALSFPQIAGMMLIAAAGLLVLKPGRSKETAAP
ncbi:DMT family transporter [Leisingera sp. ANG-Vp]|uniref:DMT family transporter n=1 Tax=Leisingera sp. ANG-Vp TaxID=1577896 RepID=UPI00057E0F21|nr:DMT family transporter [Leisingera sp. ANG-Vp]KIC17299.1 hypothetical protein RA20_15470 [Leisingera sp. ANG-Vp]